MIRCYQAPPHFHIGLITYHLVKFCRSGPSFNLSIIQTITNNFICYFIMSFFFHVLSNNLCQPYFSIIELSLIKYFVFRIYICGIRHVKSGYRNPLKTSAGGLLLRLIMILNSVERIQGFRLPITFPILIYVNSRKVFIIFIFIT